MSIWRLGQYPVCLRTHSVESNKLPTNRNIVYSRASVLLLQSGILRYLGGRFPETTSAVDENGRTALHYAATLKDNGHFYNMLVQMGANTKEIDKVVYYFYSFISYRPNKRQ